MRGVVVQMLRSLSHVFLCQEEFAFHEQTGKTRRLDEGNYS